MAKTVLIADDNESVRTILKLSLQFSGYTILEVEDGADVLGVLEKTPVDMVISDLAMPKMSGYELVARLRADARYLKLPFVLCSAEKDVNSNDAMQRGVTAVLPKPCRPAELTALAESLIGKA